MTELELWRCSAGHTTARRAGAPVTSCDYLVGVQLVLSAVFSATRCGAALVGRLR